MFFALDISSDWRSYLVGLEEELLKRASRGRAIEGENLHLTVLFLGELNSAKKLASSLRGLSLPGVSLRPLGLDSFQRKGEELVYLKLAEAKELDSLSRVLSQALGSQGFSFDKKPFRPHVSLLRRVQWKEEVDLSSFKLGPEELEVKKLTLYSSRLTPRGPVYKKRLSFY